MKGPSDQGVLGTFPVAWAGPQVLLKMTNKQKRFLASSLSQTRDAFKIKLGCDSFDPKSRELDAAGWFDRKLSNTSSAGLSHKPVHGPGELFSTDAWAFNGDSLALNRCHFYVSSN